jgi:hypothetical protein
MYHKIILLLFILVCFKGLAQTSNQMVPYQTTLIKVSNDTITNNTGNVEYQSIEGKSTVVLTSKVKGKKIKVTVDNLNLDYGQTIEFYLGSQVIESKKMLVVESLYGQKIYLYGDTITVALDNSGVLNSKFTLLTTPLLTVPPIDYTIKPIFPKPLVTGTESNISYSVKLNPNTNLQAPALNVQYYLSKDTLFSKDDIYLKDYSIYGYSEYSLSINDMTLIDASIPTGKYNLLIVIDPKKLVVETNEKNNVVVIPTTVE